MVVCPMQARHQLGHFWSTDGGHRRQQHSPSRCPWCPSPASSDFQTLRQQAILISSPTQVQPPCHQDESHCSDTSTLFILHCCLHHSPSGYNRQQGAQKLFRWSRRLCGQSDQRGKNTHWNAGKTPASTPSPVTGDQFRRIDAETERERGSQ